MKNLCDMFELKHPIKDSTCFKTSNLSYIDNFYTSKCFLIHIKKLYTKEL